MKLVCYVLRSKRFYMVCLLNFNHNIELEYFLQWPFPFQCIVSQLVSFFNSFVALFNAKGFLTAFHFQTYFCPAFLLKVFESRYSLL